MRVTVCAGQDPQPLALLVVVEADGAGVVGVALAELARRDLLEEPVRQPVPSRAAPVLYTFYYLKLNHII